MRATFLFLSLASLLLSLANLPAAETKSPTAPLSYPDMDRDGQELAAKLRDVRPEANSSFTGVLQITSRDDTVRFVPIASDISVTPTNWVVTYRSMPTNGAAAETLTITHAAGQRAVTSRSSAPAVRLRLRFTRPSPDRISGSSIWGWNSSIGRSSVGLGMR